MWSQLPQQILEEVLLRLPSSRLSTMRSVCKEWDSLLSSSSFLSCYDSRFDYGEDHVVMLKSNTSDTQVYNPSSGIWVALPFESNPLQTMEPVATEGGYVCFLTSSSILLVYNFLTNSYRQLPSMVIETSMLGSPVTVGMLIDDQTQSYKVIAIWDERGPVLEYDSRNHLWRVTARCPLSFLNFRTSQSVLCGGLLYFIVNGGPLRGGLFIRAYNIHSFEWNTPSAPLPSQDIHHPTLIEHKGRIFLAGDAAGVGIQVWRLTHWTMAWEKVTQMPEQLYEEFIFDVKQLSSHVNCLRLRDSICFISNFRRPILAYDLTKEVWHEMFVRNIPSEIVPDGSEKYLTFQPSLYDIV